MEKPKISLKDWLIVIPARLGSTRLNRKPLQDLGGKPLVVRVAENIATLGIDGAEMVVATDSNEIKKVCESHGISAALTSAKHQSGSDRCQEVAAKHKQAYILNVQGDEPFINPDDLRRLCQALVHHTNAGIASLVIKRQEPHIFQDPHTVKAVRDAQGFALYFSRAPIPWPRDGADLTYFWQHLGVYAYRRDALRRFCEIPPSPLETTEHLEQLRALENGIPIYLEPASTASLGIDTPQDLEAARARFT